MVWRTLGLDFSRSSRQKKYIVYTVSYPYRSIWTHTMDWSFELNSTSVVTTKKVIDNSCSPYSFVQYTALHGYVSEYGCRVCPISLAANFKSVVMIQMRLKSYSNFSTDRNSFPNVIRCWNKPISAKIIFQQTRASEFLFSWGWIFKFAFFFDWNQLHSFDHLLTINVSNHTVRNENPIGFIQSI